MAGADPTGVFQADNFRSQIRSTMAMGLPNLAGAAPTFRWVTAPTYSEADPAGQPYNWTAEASAPAVDIPDLAVDCAVDWSGAAEGVTEAGEINEVKVTLTILDVDWDALLANGGRPPDQVLLKGDVYNIDYVPAPTGLFSVDVYTVYATSTDSDS